MTTDNTNTQYNSNNIVPFAFKGAEVRAVLLDGEPAFVGKDVCDRLGYADATNAMKQHCKGVVKRHPLQTPGGLQEVRVLSEPDVIRLIVRSKLPEAEEFERWVFEEVLPSIRKTGSYAITQAPKPKRVRKTPIDTRFIQLKRIALASGKDEGQAVICANTGVLNETGYNPLEMMGIKALPIEGDEHYFTATDLGSEFGISGREVNQILKRAGLQIENPAKSSTASNWLPTDMGKRYGRMQDGVRSNGKGSTQTLMWKKDVASFLRPFAKTPAQTA